MIKLALKIQHKGKAMKISNKENFKEYVDSIEQIEGYKKPLGFGIARVDGGQENPQKVLQATFGVVNWNENFGTFAVFVGALKELGIELDFGLSEVVLDVNKKFIKKAYKIFSPFFNDDKEHKNIDVLRFLKDNFEKNLFKLVVLFEDEKPQSVEAVYLKLYALSLQKAELRSLNLDGAFGLLENVAWSGNIPYELEYLRKNEIELKLSGNYPEITSVDKFPRYLSHIIPHDNTRILDSAKVRMGASLAAGTTVMPGASYINFNAGTTGSVMVEGRISSSAIVGEGSDVGGGASILGVLSGTNGNAVSIGKNTLLGANSVTGIPLGDGCIVDAGIAILEGTKVTILQKSIKPINEANPELKLDENKISIVLKGLELGGCHGIHFRQNSTTGTIEASRSRREVKLNEMLH